ncbi:MAG: energy transducer TonB, partial [Bacillota bacterium]
GEEPNKIYDLTSGDNKNIKTPGLNNYSSPSYPENLRRRNIEGKVFLKLIVDKNGNTKNIEIHESSGYDSFDNAAVNAVSNWDFKPALLNGEEISVKIILPLKFELSD